MIRRFLGAAPGGSFPPPTAYSMLYNGQNGDGHVKIGLATSTDGGLTWTRSGSNPVIGLGAGGSWNSDQTHGPALLWDGSQWVAYCGGYDGTHYRIGRWTSPDLLTWTPYGSNPIIGLGAGGSFDEKGAIGPTVRHDLSASPRWQMWYSGFDASSVTTLGYADSSDGITWTKRGKVIGVGTGGDFDDSGVGGAAVYVLDGTTTYYAIYAGFHGGFYRAGYATFTDPLGSYTKHGTIAQFAGNITSLDDGLTYQSNQVRPIVLRGGVYVGYGTAFAPTIGGGTHEVSFRSTSADLVTWATPTGALLPLAGGTFDTVSAENPSVVQGG